MHHRGVCVCVQVTEKAKHYGIAASLPKPLDPGAGPTVLQYELKMDEPISCGGAYMKFVTADASFTPSGLKDDTPYTVMFGPDVCGATNKIHLILRHESPKTKEIEEKHLGFPPTVPNTANITHVFTAILYPNNNTYAILVDGDERKSGSLFEDFEPPFVPQREIDDPEDSKPEDWVDEEMIADPDATKPDDWNEDAPEFIPDPEATMPEGWLENEPAEIDDPDATKPEDWDDEEDGDWEPPVIPNPICADAPGCGEWVPPNRLNPEYKGKWTAPMIDNPAYKGEWAPRKIANPDFYNDTAPLSHIGKIGAIAIEIWTMDQDYYFDNVVVTDSVEEATKIRETLWRPKYEAEKAADEARKAEARKAEEEAEAQGEATSLREKAMNAFVETVESIFESDLVAPFADSEIGSRVQDLLVSNPEASLAAMIAFVTLILTFIVMPFVSSQKSAVEVGQRKKKDITPKDDKKEEIQEEEDEEEEDEDVSPARRRAARARRA